jgi:Alkylmercury lyase
MDPADLAVRSATYHLFVELGRAPSAHEVAAAVGRTGSDVEETWRRLHDAHALVLDRDGSIRMANPFSGVATPFRVQADGRSWYANCAWDAIGICAALDRDGAIETTCPDCDEAIALTIERRRPSDPTLLFHSLVPARRWWDDIVLT